MKLSDRTFTLLGIALYCGQKIEFCLYGIASNLSHLPEVKKDKRLCITPDVFFSSEPEARKLRRATLGQIAAAIGERLLISGAELDAFVDDRNRIAHEFWRGVRQLRGVTAIPNPDAFLEDFITRAQKLDTALQGFLSHIREAAAVKEDRLGEFTLSEADVESRSAYLSLIMESFLKVTAQPSQFLEISAKPEDQKH